MTLSRRQFLSALVGVTAAAVSLGAPVVYQTLQRARRIPLPEAPPGPLPADTATVLRALVEALFIAHPVDTERYLRYYGFHAEKIPGYRQVYIQFAQELEWAARWLYRRPFVECSKLERRQVLRPWWSLPQSRQDEIITAIFQGTAWMQHAQYVLRETLQLFMNTDAWIMVGYEAWPGMPRGLETYRQPPATG